MMRITASMLYSYTTCPHRVFLDLYSDPADRDPVSPFVELLWERGHLFEARTIVELGIPFLNLQGVALEQREELTLRAMQQGESLIYGGRIAHGRLLGEPDLLRWSDSGYEPGDIKSGAGLEGASEDANGKPKRHYAVQLALYADILRQKGLSRSKRAFVWDIHGDEVLYDLASPRTRRGEPMWDEYGEVLTRVEGIADRRVRTRPGLIGACSLCHWRSHCARAIVDADDLTLISELGPSARAKFPASLRTVSRLAEADLADLVPGGASAIPGIGAQTLRKYHARAVLQKRPLSGPYFTDAVRLPARLSELFFDVETDPFRDLCYLHGFVERTGKDPESERYVAFFADEAVDEAERQAFAQAWDYVRAHRDAVVYYYSHYERTIWRRLANRYPDVASEDDVGSLFSEERFIDLYTDIVKSRMIWPTTSLSLKVLATYLGFHWRDTDPSGAASIQWFHQWVDTGDPSVRRRILAYNEDDCRATRVLVDALRRLARSAY